MCVHSICRKKVLHHTALPHCCCCCWVTGILFTYLLKVLQVFSQTVSILHYIDAPICYVLYALFCLFVVLWHFIWFVLFCLYLWLEHCCLLPFFVCFVCELSIVLVVKIYISTNYANTNVHLKNILSTRVFQLVCDLFLYIVIIVVTCFWKVILILEGERILEAILF